MRAGLVFLVACLALGGGLAPRGFAFGTANLPALPGAVGYGAISEGHRAEQHGTPRVFRVDTLDDTENDGCDVGSCTLREALTDPDPGFICPRVSGTVTLDWSARGDLDTITSGKTLAGQTSPGGIAIANGTFEITGEDWIVQHVKIRPGVWEAERGTSGGFLNGGDTLDALRIDGARRVYVDHVSTTWACDEMIDVIDAKDVTLRHLLIAAGHEGSPGCHTEGNHNRGFLVPSGGESTRRLSVVQSWFTHLRHRSPKLVTGQQIELYSNVFGAVEQDNGFFENKLGGANPAHRLKVDVHHNLYLRAPWEPLRQQGYCPPGDGNEGDPCKDDAECSGSCPLDKPWFAKVLNDSDGGEDPGILYFADNVFEECVGSEGSCTWTAVDYTDGPSGAALDPQWDSIFCKNIDRPCLPSEVGGGDDFYEVRATSRRYVPDYDLESPNVAGLRDALDSEVGATLPSRDTVDTDLINATKSGSSRPASSDVDVGEPGNYLYPDLAVGAPAACADADADCMCDNWETTHGITAWNADEDGDGYWNIEEWANGLDPNVADYGQNALGAPDHGI